MSTDHLSKEKAFGKKKHISPLNADSDNYPPNSRIYFTCCKSLSENIIEDSFSQFGRIEYCRLLRDKNTGLSKGSGFIKYDKASSAAKAIESMDSKTIDNSTVSMKVEIAYPKGNRNRKVYTNEPEDTPARSRLFVVCPKEMKESTLYQRFRDMEGLEYTKIISDKETRESKGFAFIKFKTASAAALAMEKISEDGEIDGVKVKVLIADPKMKSTGTESVPINYERSRIPGDGPDNMNNGFVAPFPHGMGYYAYPVPMYPPLHPVYPEQYYPSFPPMPRVIVNCDSSMTKDKLYELFADCYGVELCELDYVFQNETNQRHAVGYITFSSLQAADYAMKQVHGTEFPPSSGCRVECAWEQVQNPVFRTDHHEMYIPPYPPMYAMNTSPPMNFPIPCTKIQYSTSKPISDNILQKLFSRYGSNASTHQEKENSKKIITFTNPDAAWYAAQELDQYELEENNILSVSLFLERA